MFRFGMKTLFAAMLVATVICAALFALPGWLGCGLLLAGGLLMAPIMVVGVVHTRHAGRAFFIGAVTMSLEALLLAYLVFYCVIFVGFARSVYRNYADRLQYL